jgi:hypothetical protein
MTSGKYTAYHIYQGLSYPEAQKAATWPYRLPEYQCKHSQRGYLFQFENMVERTHFDAANTSCCDQPVRNFENKPQYVESFRPMRPQNCKAAATATGCTLLEVAVESSPAMCASQQARVNRIKILCPSMCNDLAGIQGGGSFKGTYGTFRSLGMEAGEIMILDYIPDPELISGWYENCSGSRRLTEEFCGGYSISFSLNAGLNFPGGCGCDCCGEHGAFLPPFMILSHPPITNDWGNTITLTGRTVTGEGCSGGQITGSYEGIGGQGSMPWESSTKYSGTSHSRTLYRRLAGSIGSSGNSLCCGVAIRWSGADGCGDGDEVSYVLPGLIGSSAIQPASGSTLYENSGYTLSGSGACAFSSSADLSVNVACLTATPGPLYRSNGYMTRTLGGQLHFSGTEACSGCCGSGTVHLSFSNGCGDRASAVYQVRRNLAPGASSDTIGRSYRCEQFYRTLPPTGYFYRIARADLHCDGSLGSATYPFVSYFYTLEECVSGISGADALSLSGAGGCANMSGGTACCWYSDNGLSGTDFESRVAVVSGSKCCTIETSDGQWIFSGTGNACCPRG